MIPTPSPESRRRHAAGFTLIELMIVVVIVAVLAQVAYGAYQSQVRKARRSDAISMLSAVQQAQERWRANCPTYAASLTNAVPTTVALMCNASKGLGLANKTAGGYYALTLTPDTPIGGYTLSAIAVAGTSQAADTAGGCATLTLVVQNGVDTQSPAGCWSK
jgi:type IV pilus assembly protein PilE